MSTAVEESAPSIVERLDAATAGPVHGPGDSGFDLSVAAFNSATVHRPAAVVVAAGAADVAAAVGIAAGAGLSVAVQSTGHGAAAVGPESILINTQLLDFIAVDPQSRTATVGAGVRWQQVLDAASPYGLGGLCGSAPGVGVVGYTLGGGIGPVARTFGFAADHVVEIEVVTADGQLRRVSENHDRDLFWALRGGGGAFGIVTQITFRLFEIQTLHAGGMFFDYLDAPRVLHGWRDWAHQVPESVTSSVAVVNFPPLAAVPAPLRGRTVLHLRFAHVSDTEDGEALLAPLRNLATPIVDTVTEIMYSDVGSIHADPTEPMPGAERSMLLRELPVEAIDEFLATVGPVGGLPLVFAEIRALGGALSRDAEVPNAVAGRDAAFSLFAVGVLAPPIADAVPGALDSVLAAMEPWGTGGSLMNFAGTATDEHADRVRAAWAPQTRRRLTAVRDRFDPQGVFAAAARW
ncbi:FAD-binding oxidoreductase [Rhodococcus spelaei]|uniref:FAD-binding oxidoreductase n=1 Tax=Rhodococcus spelaei TaxID=2546320 RepID=A0A541AZE1_9NOCA|nr:FAD-binding oxidoreductase [Rhodococcus spelaei]TQF65439.1 FAD-binding oxidoreductase [Rhodococcus spelaei]